MYEKLTIGTAAVEIEPNASPVDETITTAVSASFSR